MPSINLAFDALDHPKFRRLVLILGRGSELLPLRLWLHCAKYHSEDGELKGYSTKEIEALAGWHGKPGAGVDAMVKVGLLNAQKGGYAVHDWQDHARHLVAYRKRAKKAADARWSSVESGLDPPMLEASTKHSPSTDRACVELNSETDVFLQSNAKRSVPKDNPPAKAVSALGTKDFSIPWMARAWWERKAGHKDDRTLSEARTTFQDMVRRGCPQEEIAKETNAERTLTEPIWEFEKRVMKNLGLAPKESRNAHQPSKRGKPLGS
jgi:hypothetical protein